MKQSYTLLILLCITLFSCNKFDGEDPDLYGSWSNGIQTYTFNSDKSYSLEYLQKGDSLNPVYADSVFGIYTIDEKRSNLTFDQKGYKLDSNDVIIYQDVNGTTWNYSIDDNLLKYESNTGYGEFTKQ